MRTYSRDPTKHWSNAGYKKKDKCERCWSTVLLQVHHCDRDRTNNASSNLETLCRRCHTREHRAEISASQRRPEVNARRGAAVSAARTGNEYPANGAALKQAWGSEYGEEQRARRQDLGYRAQLSAACTQRSKSPEYLKNLAEGVRKSWEKRRAK